MQAEAKTWGSEWAQRLQLLAAAASDAHGSDHHPQSPGSQVYFRFIPGNSAQTFPQLSQPVGNYLYTLVNSFPLRPLSEYSIIKITLIKILNGSS